MAKNGIWTMTSMTSRSTKPELFEHQARAVAYALAHKYSISALDPGLGKSRVAIELREKLQNNCLINCPSYLVSNWVKEIKLWAPKTAQITAFKAGKQLYDVCDSDYVIISYDLVQKAPWLFEWCDMYVADEAHNLKNMAANRTQFIHKNVYENSVDRVILTTGTPIKNRVQEFYSLLALCFYNPDTPDTQFLKTYPSEIDFADRFAFRREYTLEVTTKNNKKKFVPVVKWNGLKNREELKRHLRGKYLRITDKVLKLPPVRYKSMLVSTSPNESLRKAFETHFATEGNDSVKPDIKKQAAIQKVPFTIKYIKDLLEETDCVLVYSDHVEPIEMIAKEFGVKAITGNVPSTLRSKLADRFQAGEGQILPCTIGSMKEGKDFFRANHIVFNDYSWVPGDIKQVIARIRRIGQKRKCVVHKIMGSPQDEYIMNAVDEKVKVIEQAT